MFCTLLASNIAQTLAPATGWPELVRRYPFSPTATPFSPIALIESKVTLVPFFDNGAVGRVTKEDGGSWLVLLTVANPHAERAIASTTIRMVNAPLTPKRLRVSASFSLVIAVHLSGFENRLQTNKRELKSFRRTTAFQIYVSQPRTQTYL